jgi:plastocyanin
MASSITGGRRRRASRVLAWTLAAFVVSSFAFACGEPAPGDPTPVTTFKITPADSNRPTNTPAPAPSATSVPEDGAVRLEIVSVSSTFDVEELEAPAGPITIVFDNRDTGVIHNLHIYKGDSARGEDIAQTELKPGLIVQELNLNLDAGEYYYVCDAHPTTMEGSLIVS